jgi:hypothetical protein
MMARGGALVGLASLRIRLLLLVLVAVLPGIGLLLYAGAAGERGVEEGLRGEAARIANLLAQQQERSIESAQGLLNGLSRIAALASPIDAARCDGALADLRAETRARRGQPDHLREPGGGAPPPLHAGGAARPRAARRPRARG